MKRTSRALSSPCVSEMTVLVVPKSTPMVGAGAAVMEGSIGWEEEGVRRSDFTRKVKRKARPAGD